jgi:MFS family permease
MACWSNEVTLMIGTIATGLAYGGSFAILPLTTSNYYGDAHFGMPSRYPYARKPVLTPYILGINYALLQVYTNIASLLFSFIAGKIYDAFASVILPNGTHICYGMYCYSFTFTMTAGCSVIATALVIWLTVRERRHDRMLQEKVLAESAVN